MLQTYPYPTPTFHSLPWATSRPDAFAWQWAVIDAVCDLYGATEARLKGRGRTQDITVPRQVAMSALRDLSGMSYAKIGAVFGRDHTTAIHACARFPGTSAPVEQAKRRARQLVEGGA